MARANILTSMWEGLVLRGLAAILFGLTAVFWPGLTLVTLVYLFSAFILATGIVGLVVGLTNLFKRNGDSVLNNILLTLLAIAEIGVGLYLLRHIDVSFKTFILIVGLILIARGAIDFVLGLFAVFASSAHRWMMYLSGILTAAVGVIILFQPVSGGVAFVWVLGVYALITGPLLLAMAYDVKQLTP